MKRVLTITVVAAIAFIACVFALKEWLGHSTDRRHQSAYVGKRIASASTLPDTPTLAWMGDSTIMHGGYPGVIAAELRKDPGARTLIEANWARNAYNHYCNLGDVLRVEPTLVIFIANLRRFETLGSSEQGLAACSRIPASELPRAVFLPFARQGITLPGLLLMQTLRWDLVRETSERIDDTRWVLRNVPWADLVRGPSIRQVVRARNRELMEENAREQREGGGADARIALSMWQTRLAPWHPTVRMLAAAVEMATRRGTQAIVLVGPVPYASLGRLGYYDRLAFERQIEGIRSAVEPAGGRLLDLHRILPEELMSDDFGHLKPTAAQPIALFLTPILRRVLAEGLGVLPAQPLVPALLAEFAPDAVLPGSEE